MTARLLWLLAAVAAAGPAGAANRCTIDGRVVYQDLPCPQTGETVARGLERRQRDEQRHRLLDDMAARGVGLVSAAPPPPPRPAPEAAWRPQSRAELEAQRRGRDERYQAETLENNRRAGERLTAIGNEMAQACGGPPAELPTVGMSDQAFRECTLKARFGGIQQVVAVEHEGVALRLYIFASPPAQRVYSIGGVVTAIRP